MEPGSKIGKYEVLEKIGQGSFGVVYKGRDPFIKRIVAIKVCVAEDEDLRKRFFREAQIAGTLQHKNLVTVYDFGIQDEAPFMVQEYLEGEDLSDLIDRKEDLPLATRLKYLIQVAAGLSFAHGEDVIHRDIKPGNIRVLPDEKVKIMDFGIAKLTSSKTRLTQAGTTIGTAGYLSPEQLQAGELDARTDIFSFGVLAYEFLVHERPFRGNTFSKVAYQILYTPPMPLSASWPNCPVELERIISRCLEKRREDRYSNCGEIIVDFEKLLAMDEDGVTEKIGPQASPASSGSPADGAPAPPVSVAPGPMKEPSPEATIAMQLPLVPRPLALDRATRPAEATSQAPPKTQEEKAPPETGPAPAADQPTPKTIVLPLRGTRPATPAEPEGQSETAVTPPALQVPDAKTAVLRDPAEKVEQPQEASPSQVLPSIDEALPATPPAPTASKKPPQPTSPKKTKTPKAKAKTPAAKPESAPAKPPEKPSPERVTASKPSPWSRLQALFGSLPPGQRKAVMAAGASLLLLLVVIALWPAGEEASPAPPAPTPEPIEQVEVATNGELATEMARLRVDSMPWARVLSIESITGEVLDIPVDTTTPFLVALPPGTWIVTMSPGPDLPEVEGADEVGGVEPAPEIAPLPQEASEPDSEELPLDMPAEGPPTLTCQVKVAAGQVMECRVRFIEPDPSEYFLEAGWWD